MALDAFKNFGKVAVSTGYNAAATSIVLTTGEAAKLPVAPFNAVWYNSSDYPDPTDDPNKEVIRVTAIASETLTITRAQESTSAVTHNDSGKSYKLIVGLTAKTFNTDLFGNAHTWLSTQTGQKTSLGTTTSAAWIADNTTAATASVLQASPSYLRRGRGFLSNSSTSIPFEIQDYAIGKVNVTAYGRWINQYRANSGTWTDFFTFDSEPGGLGFNFIPTAGSNSNPGTTRAFTINNAGSTTWIDFLFGGVRKSHIGADSGGALKFYTGGGSYMEYYNMSGNSLFSYSYPQAFYHIGHGLFSGKVSAGSGSTPSSTLSTAGGTALKVGYSTSNLTLDDTATQWILEPSSPSCVGTITNPCSYYTNQSDCEARDAHGGCSWYAGSSCSIYSGDIGTCSGTSGCTVDTADCSGASDESSCYAQDDSYGGSCSWSNGNDCSTFGDESSCAAQSGCTPGYSSCSWDGMSCYGGTGCDGYYDESSCVSAMYFSGCSGTYGAGCSGSYNTGGCSGSFGASCTGTAACSGIDDSTNCGNESGCSWSTSITANLPDGDTVPSRTLWIYKKGASGTVVISPVSGQTVNFASSYTMTSDKDWIHLAYYKITADCSVYNSNESTCGATSGCSPTYSSCSWDSMSMTCSGNSACDGIGDESICLSTTFYSNCAGTYAVSKNWYKFGS